MAARSKANLKATVGFFLMTNSHDYPANYSPNKPFGFRDNDTTKAVFSYSLNQVRNGFTEPREYITNSYYDNKANNLLLVESFQNEALASQDVNSTDWTNVFRIIEWGYLNQATINISQPVDPAYKTYANEKLAATRINEEENPYYVSNYINGSFTYTLSTKSGRLSHVMFKALVKGEQVSFDIFYDPDAYMTERVTLNDWAIYVYEDKDNDDSISEEEWEMQIVRKLWEIQKEKHYNRVDKFITSWCKEDPETPGGWKPAVQRTHYLFNNYPAKPESAVTREMKKNKVKEWVLKKNNNNYEYSAKEYPELFSDQQVLIVPVYDNYRTSNDGQQILIHPLSEEKLERIKARFFNASVMSSTDKLEIFHVGSDGEDSANRKADIYPLVAGEMTVDDSVTYPISSRFPEFYPRIITSSFNPQDNDYAANFHFILMKVLGYHQKRYQANEIKNLTPAEEVEIVDTTPAEVGYVSFKYRGCVFKVMAPYESVQS